MSGHSIEDLDKDIHALKMFPPRFEEMPIIKCGSFDRLWAAIEARTGSSVKPINENSGPVARMRFGGVDVFESSILPKNIVVLLKGSEVVQIINLDHSQVPSIPEHPFKPISEAGEAS